MKITPKFFSLLTLYLTVILSTGLSAKAMNEIDAAIENSLNRFTEEIQGGDTYLDGARGVLVIPRMWKAGVLIGFEFGEGALIVDGIKVQYYKALTTSLGIQVGIGSKDLIILFFDDTAMDNFLYSSGWEVGVDGAVALFTIGAAGAADTITIKDPIIGFVFGQKGLLAGVSIEGTKFTKIWPDTGTEIDQDQEDIETFNERLTD
jgi:lipid-binding SYLF domain-containing protein